MGDPSWTEVDRHAIGCPCAACAQRSADAPLVGMVDMGFYFAPRPTGKLVGPVAEILDRIEARLERIEKALKSGAIGAWGNPR